MLTTVNELYIPLLQEDPRVRVSGVGGGKGAFHKFPSSAGGAGSFPQESCSARKWRKSVNVNSQHFTLQRAPRNPQSRSGFLSAPVQSLKQGFCQGVSTTLRGNFDKFI